ncbi:MAG: hypothetical protein IAG10_34580, partial [Planctomycetaceae bacterium]|nr:hypothetical protein [Planctomycetaceae bacterium]
MLKLFNFLRRHRKLSRARNRRQPTQVTSSVACEVLEVRQVMTADLQVALVNGVLQINGNDQANEIIIRQSGNDVTVDGVTGRWQQPAAILVHAYGGNDVVR